MANPPGSERRRSTRRAILDSFGMFMSIPKKGGYRLPVHDVSSEGLAFDLDVDGEDFRDFPAKVGETLDVELFLNPSIGIPLRVKLVRVTQGTVRKVGAEIDSGASKGRQAYEALVALVDALPATG